MQSERHFQESKIAVCWKGRRRETTRPPRRRSTPIWRWRSQLSRSTCSRPSCSSYFRTDIQRHWSTVRLTWLRRSSFWRRSQPASLSVCRSCLGLRQPVLLRRMQWWRLLHKVAMNTCQWRRKTYRSASRICGLWSASERTSKLYSSHFISREGDRWIYGGWRRRVKIQKWATSSRMRSPAISSSRRFGARMLEKTPS